MLKVQLLMLVVQIVINVATNSPHPFTPQQTHRGFNDTAFHIVFSNDSHFHLFSLRNPHVLSLKLTDCKMVMDQNLTDDNFSEMKLFP